MSRFSRVFLAVVTIPLGCRSDPPPPAPDPATTAAPLAGPGGDVTPPLPSATVARRFPGRRPSTLGGFRPDDHRPMELPMAPGGWPRWEGAVNPRKPRPPSNATTARALADEVERHLVPVPTWDDVPWEWRRRALQFDAYIFLEAAHAWEPRDLKVAYRPDSEAPGPSFAVARTWTVGSEGAHVRLEAVESLQHAIVRLRPLEWLDASLEDRLGWTRTNLPRFVRIRGFDEGFNRRADIDLRYRPTGPREAELATPVWSTWSTNWYDNVFGWVDERGVTLLIRRRHKYGNSQSFEQ